MLNSVSCDSKAVAVTWPLGESRGAFWVKGYEMATKRKPRVQPVKAEPVSDIRSDPRDNATLAKFYGTSVKAIAKQRAK